MSDPTFMADPTRLVIAAIVGIALLLALFFAGTFSLRRVRA